VDDEYQRAYFVRSEEGNVRLQPVDTPYVRRHLERTLDAADVRPGQRVLEVGAGLGRFSTLIADRGARLVASDLSSFLLERLRARRPEIETLACDVADVGERAPGAFDRVVGFFMLHHLEDLDRVFASLRRALAPGGRIAFAEPNAWCALYYVQIALSRQMTWRGDGGVRNMRPGVVCRALERAGFVEAACDRYGFTPPFLYNRRAGRALDRGLEAVPIFTPFRAFQVFSARVAPSTP
jgi:SAM-dependent methyltransferase